jgi:hypothetical protein
MWFGPAAQPDGYVFLHLAGMIDTSAALTGAMAPFVYKIGTDAHYVQVTLPDKPFTIVENQAEFRHLIVDYFKLFNGLSLSDPAALSVTTPAANGSATANTVAANIPLLFDYEP